MANEFEERLNRVKQFEASTLADLEAAYPEMLEIQTRLDDLKEIGLDVSVLQEKLDWSKKVRSVLMKHKKKT